MKLLRVTVFLLFIPYLSLQAQSDFVGVGIVAEHGGRNGGEGIEIELKILSQKILAFLQTPLGKETFPELNLSFLDKVVNVAHFSVVTYPLLDRYNIERTCINYPSTMRIECNLTRLGLIKDPRVYDVLIFHEILGLGSIELGHELDVSLYPISSRIIPFHDFVIGTDLSYKNIRPEFYALKNKSYGLTLTSKTSDESLKLICIEDRAPQLCDYFSFVRKLGDIQMPLVADMPPLSKSMLKDIHEKITILYYKKSTPQKLKDDIITALSFVNFLGELSLIGKEEKINAVSFKSIATLINLRIEDIRSNCFSLKNSPAPWCNREQFNLVKETQK